MVTSRTCGSRTENEVKLLEDIVIMTIVTSTNLPVHIFRLSITLFISQTSKCMNADEYASTSIPQCPVPIFPAKVGLMHNFLTWPFSCFFPQPPLFVCTSTDLLHRSDVAPFQKSLCIILDSFRKHEEV